MYVMYGRSLKAAKQKGHLHLHCRLQLLFLRSTTRAEDVGVTQHPENDKDSDDDDDDTEFAGGNVQVIKTIEAWEAKLSEAKTLHKIIVANFSATWCGPCKVIAPYYRELSEKYPYLMFLVVDVDELVDFSTSWEIKATPTFFFLRDGKQIDKLVGANKPELAKKIATIGDSVSSLQK